MILMMLTATEIASTSAHIQTLMNVAEGICPCDKKTCCPMGVALSLKSGRFGSFQVRFSLTSLRSIVLSSFPTTLCGVPVFRSVPPVFRLSRCPPPLCHTQLCHTPSFTYLFVTLHLSQTLSQTIFPPNLSHTIFHIQLCHTPSFSHTILSHTPSFTHFVTHHLSHTTLSHTNFVTHQLCHTPSFTHNFVIHQSSAHIFVTHHLPRTSLSPTIFHTQLCHTPSSTYIFVTHHLSHTSLSHTIFHTPLSHTTLSHTIWQARHLQHVAGSGGVLGAPWWRVTPRHFCVAGVAWLHPASLRVARVAPRDIHLRFAWPAWHLWDWAKLVAHLGPGPFVGRDAAALLRGRRGTR